MKKEEIAIRDPFILLDNNRYYMYGSRSPELWGKCNGLDVYVSEDLEEWSEAYEVFTRTDDFWADANFWAPEVHKINDKYYMFASFRSDTRINGTQILISDSPMGPFIPHSDGPVTPDEWCCIDGTPYIDKNGRPYIIFCHSWTEVTDGEICALELSEDLSSPIGKPILLFRASESGYATPYNGETAYVTDGPFVYRMTDGKLIMIWSSFADHKYCELIAYSDNGEITGKWKHFDEPLFSSDGGHGMIFRDKNGELNFTMHCPNTTPDERPKIIPIKECDGTIKIK